MGFIDKESGTKRLSHPSTHREPALTLGEVHSTHCTTDSCRMRLRVVILYPFHFPGNIHDQINSNPILLQIIKYSSKVVLSFQSNSSSKYKEKVSPSLLSRYHCPCLQDEKQQNDFQTLLFSPFPPFPSIAINQVL